MLNGVWVGLGMSLAVMGSAADYNPAAKLCHDYYKDRAAAKSDLEELRSSIQSVREDLYRSSSDIHQSGQISVENALQAASVEEILRWGEKQLYEGYQFAEYCDRFLLEDE